MVLCWEKHIVSYLLVNTIRLVGYNSMSSSFLEEKTYLHLNVHRDSCLEATAVSMGWVGLPVFKAKYTPQRSRSGQAQQYLALVRTNVLRLTEVATQQLTLAQDVGDSAYKKNCHTTEIQSGKSTWQHVCTRKQVGLGWQSRKSLQIFPRMTIWWTLSSNSW